LSSRTFGNDLDAVILKCNINGERIDSIVFSGVSQNNDYIVSMVSDRDVNTYVSLISKKNAIDFEAISLKINSAMNIVWEIGHIPPVNVIYYPKKLFVIGTNNLLLIGNTNSTSNPELSYDTDIDYSISNIDTSGRMKNEFIYSDSGTSNFRLSKMEIDTDNNIYISGYSQIGPDYDNFVPYFNYNYFIFKYNINGEILWSESIDNDTLKKQNYVYQFKKDSVITIIGNAYKENSDRKYTILYTYNLEGRLIRSKAIDNAGYSCSNSVSDENGNLYLYIPRYDNTYSSIIKLNPELEIEWNYHLNEISQLEENVLMQIDASGMIYIGSKDRKLTIINNNGTLFKEIPLSQLFNGFTALCLDGMANVYIGGYTLNQTRKAVYAKIDHDGNIIWQLFDSNIEWVKEMFFQKESGNIVIVGAQCSVVGCTPTIISRISDDGIIKGSVTLPNVSSNKVVSDDNDFLYIANSKDNFVMVSPDLELLFQSDPINDSICFTYSLSDIKIDYDQNIIITGTFGNEIYLSGNEWNAITTVKFRKPNTRPLIQNILNYYRILPLDTLIVKLQIKDYDDDPYTLEFTEIRDWVEFNSSESKIIFTPDFTSLGINNIQLAIKDNSGNSSTYSFVVKVGNTPPYITSSPLLTIQVEEDYLYKTIATDIDNDSLVFKLLESPSWLNITTQGVITGIPNTAGSYKVSLVVRDEFGGEAIQKFDINVISVTTISDVSAPGSSESKFLIYPNPSDEFIYIKPLSEIIGGITVYLIDLNGKILDSINFPSPVNGEVIPMDVKTFKPAIYYLIILEKAGLSSYKVVIE
jgi:hypothetical protein